MHLGVGGRQQARLALAEGLTLLSCFGCWLEGVRGDKGWPRPGTPHLPSRGLCESPWCGEGAWTFVGLRARGCNTAGIPPSCGLAASTDRFPPCWVGFGGAGASHVLGAPGLPRAGVPEDFIGVLPCGALGTPTLPCVLGATREGVGAWLGTLQPELGRGAALDGSGCCPKGGADGARVLQEERVERGRGAAASLLPSILPGAGHFQKGQGKECRDVRKTAQSGWFGARSIPASLTCPKGPSGAAASRGWHPQGDLSPPEKGDEGRRRLGIAMRQGAGGSASG